MMVTVLTTHSSPLLCGCVVIMPPVNWQGLHLGGGTASTATKKTSVGCAPLPSPEKAAEASAGYSCERSGASRAHTARKCARSSSPFSSVFSGAALLLCLVLDRGREAAASAAKS